MTTIKGDKTLGAQKKKHHKVIVINCVSNKESIIVNDENVIKTNKKGVKFLIATKEKRTEWPRNKKTQNI